MQDFKKLAVWKRSHELTLTVYRLTSPFPHDEAYGLTSQLRRAAAAVPANIAEGCGRDTGPDMARFLQIALGSASELEYHLLLAKDLNLLQAGDYEAACVEVTGTKRMLTSLIQRVRPTRNHELTTDNRRPITT